MPLPWWITEVAVAPDNHLNESHIHVDHQYVAIVDNPNPVRCAAHPFDWYTEDQVAALVMFEDTKLLAKALFASMNDLTQRIDWTRATSSSTERRSA